MEKIELVCIGCPLGCNVTVTMEQGEIVSVHGNTCRRGEEYARGEVTHPTRIVTSTVKVEDGTIPVVSCKTNSEIPKEKIFECMEQIRAVSVKAPVQIGDVLISNVANTDVDIIATKNVLRSSDSIIV